MIDEIESGESASAKRYAVKCTGITQNAVAYPVTEIALVSGRGEMRGENKRSMIALGEPEGMNSGRCAKDLRTSGSQCGGGRCSVLMGRSRKFRLCDTRLDARFFTA